MTAFDLDVWDEVADLIEEALGMPPADRGSWLNRRCPERRLRVTVEELVSIAERADAFLEAPAYECLHGLAREAVEDAEPPWAENVERLGPYRVAREIGRGGMGEVYLAERADDEFRRQVAIKVVRAGGPDLLERFRRERQILASLDHENIARLYDGGATEDGRPFFVMEYVRGEPIDRFADGRRLDVDARLGLFVAVARAVAYAHRRLVVHRDLKPANVLVVDDGTVKLLDFGLAKVLQAEDELPEDAGRLTRAGFRVLTPQYASPEQFTGEPVATASDVYSLGVLLHELLAGSGPYGSVPSGPRAIERAILEGIDARPSAAVASGRESGASEAVAAARGTTVLRLRRRLRGDLDTIVATALRREPEHRYPTVDALVDDVERHRARRPIRARPQTLLYRAGRFVRRHRVGVALGGAVLVSVAGGVGATLHQAEATSREAARAERIREFLVGVFEISDPDRGRGEAVTARELLDRGFARAGEELTAEPAALADMMSVFGTLYLRLGLIEESERAFAQALDLRRTWPAPAGELAEAVTNMATVRAAQGDWQAAESLQREALDVLGRDGAAGTRARARTLLDLAASLSAQARYDEADPLYEEVLRVRREAGDSLGVAEVLNGYGLLRARTGDVVRSRELLERSVSIRRALLGPEHTDVAVSLCNLANAADAAGDYDDAMEAYAECLDIRRPLLGEAHPAIARTLNNMGIVASKRGDLAGADTLHRQALDIRRRSLGDVHEEVAGSLNNLAVVAYQRGDLAAAAEAFGDVLAQWRALVGEDHPNTITTLNNLGMALMADGRVEAAEPPLREALEARVRVLGPEHQDVAGSHANLSTLFLRQGDTEGAEREARAAIVVFDARYPEGHPNAAGALLNLVRIYAAKHACARVLTEAERAVSIRRDRLGEDHPSTADARVLLGRCLIDAGRGAEAVPLLASARATLMASRGADHESTREAEAVLEAARAR